MAGKEANGEKCGIVRQVKGISLVIRATIKDTPTTLALNQFYCKLIYVPCLTYLTRVACYEVVFVKQVLPIMVGTLNRTDNGVCVGGVSVCGRWVG